MSTSILPARQDDIAQSDAMPARAAPRYHAMDCVRATAMLLGVFYHLPIAMMGGGFFSGIGSPKTSIDNWLHSFRMPLFFLISGFFANMVLGKYGLGKYMARRWWRIGAPLIVPLFAFGLLRSFAPSIVPPSFGGMLQAPARNAAPPPGGAARGGTPAPQPGFVAPGAPNPGQAGPGAAGMPNPFTPPAGFVMPPMPLFPSSVAAEQLFGKYAPNFRLEHLWFLWYLLIFVTVAPFIAMALSRILTRAIPSIDGLGLRMIRFDLLAPALALLSLPALIHARGFFGWSLTNPIGFMGAFPDFLWQYARDLPFYFVYFLVGWWMFRLRANLNDLGRLWLWNLVLGIAGFAVSQWMFRSYGMQAGPGLGWMALCGFALYGLGAAYSAFGLIGLFQRYLDRPTRLGRYFTDTMLWVYLVQLAIIPHVIFWIEPWRTSWWEASLAGVVVVTAIALVLYELLVRPTPLVYIFGPPQKRRTQ